MGDPLHDQNDTETELGNSWEKHVFGGMLWAIDHPAHLTMYYTSQCTLDRPPQAPTKIIIPRWWVHVFFHKTTWDRFAQLYRAGQLRLPSEAESKYVLREDVSGCRFKWVMHVRGENSVRGCDLPCSPTKFLLWSIVSGGSPACGYDMKWAIGRSSHGTNGISQDTNGIHGDFQSIHGAAAGTPGNAFINIPIPASYFEWRHNTQVLNGTSQSLPDNALVHPPISSVETRQISQYTNETCQSRPTNTLVHPPIYPFTPSHSIQNPTHTSQIPDIPSQTPPRTALLNLPTYRPQQTFQSTNNILLPWHTTTLPLLTTTINPATDPNPPPEAYVHPTYPPTEVPY
jgi:hypothetical protein